MDGWIDDNILTEERPPGTSHDVDSERDNDGDKRYRQRRDFVSWPYRPVQSSPVQFYTGSSIHADF